MTDEAADAEVEAEIDAILSDVQRVVVFGLSPDPARDSYRVASYLQDQGITIVPVNPEGGEQILGEPVVATLADVSGSIDVVGVFRRPEFTDAPIDGAVAIGARTIWLQLGISNDAGLARARAAGLRAVEDRCLMVEHRKRQAARERESAG